MSNETQAVTSPIGDLEWIFITGKGKKDPKGNDRFVASLVLPSDSDACKSFKNDLEEFWDTYKPAKAKNAKSLGYRELEDEDGNPTGRTSFNFWTGISFPDGQDKVVKVFNAKGAEVSLGSKKIGNGSRGRIKGAMAIYDVDANRGVTLYLNGIQLTKFIPFEGGVNFDAVEDEEAGDDTFEGIDDDGMNAIPETETNQEARPRL